MTTILANTPEIRMQYIVESDPKYFSDIMDFLEEHKEFKPFLKYVSLTATKIRDSNIKNLNTVKDCLIYYVSEAGVSPSYGLKVYNMVLKGDLSKLTEKKRSDILRVLNYDKYNNIKSAKDVDNLDVKGVGDGAKKFVKEIIFGETNIFYHTERRVLLGLSKIYGRKFTVKESEKISEKYKQKYVACMFCLQVGLYHK